MAKREPSPQSARYTWLLRPPLSLRSDTAVFRKSRRRSARICSWISPSLLIEEEAADLAPASECADIGGGGLGAVRSEKQLDHVSRKGGRAEDFGKVIDKVRAAKGADAVDLLRAGALEKDG